MKEEFGEVIKFYSPKSGWLILYRIDLIFMTEKKEKPDQLINSSSFNPQQLHVSYKG